MGLLSFLQPVEHGVAAAAHGVGTATHATFSFLQGAEHNRQTLNTAVARQSAGPPVTSKNPIIRAISDEPTAMPAAPQPVELAQQTITRPAAELISSALPEQKTYTPGSKAEQVIFGKTPIQNIEKKTASNYDAHASLPTAERLALAGGEAAASLAQDIPTATGEFKFLAKGAKEASVPVKKAIDTAAANVTPLNEGGYISGGKAQITKPNFTDENGTPRAEVDDSKATVYSPSVEFNKLSENEKLAAATSGGKNYTLPDILQHPTLYNDYPQLKDVAVKFVDFKKDSTNGGFSEPKNTIYINKRLDSATSQPELKEAVLHETQHVIQKIEGLKGGTNTIKAGGFQEYYKDPGEVEARAVGERADMTPEQRAQQPLGTPLTNDDIHKLTQATSIDDVKRTLKGKVPDGIVDRTAPAIIATKDPSIIDNILTRASTKDTHDINRATPQDVVPATPVAASEAAPVAPAANADSGLRALTNLAKTSQDFDEFAGKFSSLPDNANVKAAIEQSGAGDLRELYDKVNHKVSDDPAAQQIMDALQGRAASPGVSAVKGARSIRAAQEASYKVERGQRIAQAGEASKNLTGTDAYKAKLASLRGDLQKEEYQGLKGQLSPDRAEALYADLHNKVEDLPIDDYGKLNTQTALRKVIFGEGGVPTKSEIRLLQNAFGEGFADTVKEDVARHTKIVTTLQKAGEVIGVPRAIMASADLSGGFRQALAAATRHPLVYAQNFVQQFKDFSSEKAFQESQKEIYNDPDYDLSKEAGLAIQDLGQGVDHREEKFVSSLAEKIPVIGHVIRASDRAFTGLLNNMRFNIFKQLAKNAENAGIDLRAPENAKLREDLAKVVNTATGRGDFGKFFQKHADTLSTVFFSPRLMASRIQTLNPAYYIKLEPLARREALTTLASLGAFATTVLGLAELGGAQVVKDPRNSDFGKIKIGDTRFDILGGYQQYLKLGAQLGSGKIISSVTGHEEKIGSGFGSPTRLDVVESFLQGKENPALSFVTDLLKGKDAAGNSLYNPKGISGEVASRFIPLILQDLNDLRTHPTGAGYGAIIPSAFGVGIQTYGVSDIGISPKDQSQIDKLQKNGAPAEELNANQLFYQTLKNAPDRTKISGEINQALAKGDMDTAQKLADTYNQQYAQHFKDWADKYGKYSNADLVAAYNKNKLNLTPNSVKARIKGIQSNPSLYQATTGG